MAAVVLHRMDRAVLGRFDLSADDPRWAEPNDIGSGVHVVFPGTAVWIGHGREAQRVCDPTQLVLYGAHQAYSRRILAPQGDHCLFLQLADPGFPRLPQGLTCPPRLYLAVHALRRRLSAGCDAAAADESLATVVDAVVRVIAEAVPAASTLAPSRRVVEDAKAVLALRYAEPLHLAGIAHEVGLSPFHLARVFRESTGTTLHAYLTSLRVRHVAAAGGSGRLSDVAVETGFASHSHLSERFRSHFGVAPSGMDAAGAR